MLKPIARILALLVATVIALTMPTAAQAPVKVSDGTVLSPSEIDITVLRLMAAADVTGLGLSIVSDGEIVFEKAYGTRDLATGLPLTVRSVMTAASFTKVAFACLVMQLVEEKVLDLDTPVTQALPQPLWQYPNYRDLEGDSRAATITPRMLLSHTAGFANFRSLEPDRKLRIHFNPGSRYAYSGEGIQLLQFVVETLTKQPLDDLMRTRLFQPLGMTRTGMIWREEFESEFANAYDEQGKSLGPQRRRRADAAGSMQTTLEDYTRFLRAFLTGRVLSAAAQQAMLSPQVRIRSERQFPTLAETTTTANDTIRLSYGLGWGLYWTPAGRAFFKEGHDEGWRHYAVGFDGNRSGLIVMTNSSNGEGIFKALLETVYKNPYTPIVWEGYTPYEQLPPRP